MEAGRRDFLKRTLSGVAAAGAVGVGAKATAANKPAKASKPGQVDRVTLGGTGAEVSRIGIGLGSAFSAPTDGKQDLVAEMLSRAVELGINYFDTAHVYGTEERIGEAIESYRDDLFLVSKSQERDYDGFMRNFETSLKLLRTDHLNLFHIHSLGQNGKESSADLVGFESGCLKGMLKLKDEGVIRHWGVTGHSGAQILTDAIERWNPEVIMTVFPATPELEDEGRYESLVLPTAKKHNMGIVAMKTVRRARESDLKASDLPRYALSLPGIHVANIGYDAIAHLEDNVAMASNFKPLNVAERESFSRQVTESCRGLVAPWERPGYEDGKRFLA